MELLRDCRTGRLAKGGQMTGYNDKLDKQSHEDRETTRQWERDRVNPIGQEPEDPQRTREWNEDKKPEKK